MESGRRNSVSVVIWHRKWRIATAKGKLLSRFHDIFATAMMAQAEIHVPVQRQTAEIMTDAMKSLDLQATKSLGQAEDLKNPEADWADLSRGSNNSMFWESQEVLEDLGVFFTLPLWCSPDLSCFLEGPEENKKLVDPRFRRQYNSKCGQCGHVPGGSLEETTHQKNSVDSLQVKISLWKHVMSHNDEMMKWCFFHVFPWSSWQETYWLAADFSRGNKKLFSFSDCMDSIGFVWHRELSDSDLAFGQFMDWRTRSFWMQFSAVSLQVCTSNDWSISTSEVSCTMCWSSTSHVRLAPQCGGCSYFQVCWFFRFPRELTPGDLVKCLKVGQCSDVDGELWSILMVNNH